MFVAGLKDLADKMKTTFDRIVNYIGRIHGPDIASEISNRKTLITPQPTYPEDVLTRHGVRVEIKRSTQKTLVEVLKKQHVAAKKLATDNEGDLEAPVLAARIGIQVLEAELALKDDVDMKMSDAVKFTFQNDHKKWR